MMLYQNGNVAKDRVETQSQATPSVERSRASKLKTIVEYSVMATLHKNNCPVSLPLSVAIQAEEGGTGHCVIGDAAKMAELAPTEQGRIVEPLLLSYEGDANRIGRYRISAKIEQINTVTTRMDSAEVLAGLTPALAG